MSARFGGGERGRPISRRTPPANGSDGLSNFYRERFGSHSPEEYMNLRLSRMDKAMSREEITRALDDEFRRFAPYEIKIVRNQQDDERIAYVNFERPDAARKIRKTLMEKLQRTLGRRLLIDPAGIIRDQEGKYIPDRYNRALLQTDRVEPRAAPSSSVARGAPRKSAGGGGAGPGSANGQTWRLKQSDTDASRTLFVGNLPADIRETEIRKVFEQHGIVEDVDIKKPADTNAAYAFVMFHTIDQAMVAKHTEHDRPIRPCSSRCKIGYGKSQVSRRLWVGGLGAWTSSEQLLKEFDRYGLIEKMDYDEGSEVAYIRFADSNAAADACRAMRGFPLGGKDRCIMVDYAKDREEDEGGGGRHGVDRERGGDREQHRLERKRRAPSDSRSRTPPTPIMHRRDLSGPRTPPDSPVGEERRQIRTTEELDAEIAHTWIGQIVLKKTEYPVRMYRVAGTEKVLQKLLRDDDGNAVKLSVTQRLALSSQDALEERVVSCSEKQLSVMVAVGREERLLRPLVKYLGEKEAAGVAALPDGVLYLMPASSVADRLLSHFAPAIRLLHPGSPHLLCVLIANPTD